MLVCHLCMQHQCHWSLWACWNIARATVPCFLWQGLKLLLENDTKWLLLEQQTLVTNWEELSKVDLMSRPWHPVHSVNLVILYGIILSIHLKACPWKPGCTKWFIGYAYLSNTKVGKVEVLHKRVFMLDALLRVEIAICPEQCEALTWHTACTEQPYQGIMISFQVSCKNIMPKQLWYLSPLMYIKKCGWSILRDKKNLSSIYWRLR